MRRAAALALSAAIVLAGCAGRGGHGDQMAGPFRPLGDRQLELMLGSYPTPGPNASEDIHDSEGHVVARPARLVAYADEVVAYEPGVPGPIPEGSEPRTALGAPDYHADPRHLPRAVSLGNGGSITLGFSTSAIVDGDGPDIFIFEVGPSVEAMNVDISADGKQWIPVGTAWGGPCAVDIGPHVAPGEAFRYVRIRDVAHQGAESDSWPGADIDAVGVIAAAQRLALPSEVLFEFDRDTLAPGAPAALDRVVQAIRARGDARVTVEGHTDDVGTEEYNQGLSDRRAQAVADYLAQNGVPRDRITARGLGESRPVAPNDGDDNRRKNRRVEIVIQGK